MSILSKISSKRVIDFSFLGIRIPRKCADFLNLYCAANGLSKTSIIMDLTEKWVEKTKKETKGIKTLEIQIANNANEALSEIAMSSETFKKLLKIELRQKKVNEESISRILNLIKDEKNKDG